MCGIGFILYKNPNIILINLKNLNFHKLFL